MNYEDFNVVGNYYTDLYDLKIGDYFREDTYKEVYLVKEIVVEDMGIKDEDWQTVYKTWNITDNESCDWFYNPAFSQYSPTLLKLEPKFINLVPKTE
jgi:hypothetical protein